MITDTLLNNYKVVDLACGYYHVLALTDLFQVLVWGHGGYGALGQENTSNLPTPKVLDLSESLRSVLLPSERPCTPVSSFCRTGIFFPAATVAPMTRA